MSAAKPQTPDLYVSSAPAFARPILDHIRKLVKKVCPASTESIKWSHIFFEHQGMLCMVAAFKAHCSLGFWHHGMKAVLKEKGFRPRQGAGDFGALRTLGDLPSDAVLANLIRAAAALNADGGPSRAPSKPKKPAAVPPELNRALKANSAAAKTFGAFSPSAQREYIEWITDAKREETRAQRLATTLEWLAEGKKRNWKYANC